MSSRWLHVSATLCFLLAVANQAHAITNGALDGQGHPYVGLMVADTADGLPLWRCSGALLSPTVFLTAGHCTEAPAARATIWFESDVDAGIPANGYPLSGPTSVDGKLYTHPQYDPNDFARYDLGVVVLDNPVNLNQYATLPQLNELDRFAKRRGLQDVKFTAVGYGLQAINPVFIEAERVRMVSTPSLIQINNGIVKDYSLLLSNNHATGGTCFGDSGGPNFIGSTNVVAGVTSFALNGNCGGTGGVYRVDRADDLNWLSTFLSNPTPGAVASHAVPEPNSAILAGFSLLSLVACCRLRR